MDEDMILAKLESLRRCVGRARQKAPSSRETLVEDYDLQDIISVNLERAIQTCVDIAAHLLAGTDASAPQCMGEGFDALAAQGVLPAELADRMKKAVGFRNISVHRYQNIDWSIVYSIVTERLDDFSAFAGCIARQLEREEE